MNNQPELPVLPSLTQQAGVIRVRTDLRVGQYYSDLGVDLWKAERWAEEIKKNQVSKLAAHRTLAAMFSPFKGLIIDAQVLI